MWALVSLSGIRAVVISGRTNTLAGMSDTSKPESTWIIETDDDSFDRDVIERSHELPVVVDFWAAWCAPCRALAPLLHDLADERNGKFVLVKADTDQTPQAAARFNVQGIPAVFGVVGGEIVDFFTGAMPAEQLGRWLDRLLATAALRRAEKFEVVDPKVAEATYRELAAQLPNESAAAIGLAWLLLGQDRTDEAKEVIDRLADRGFLEPEAEKVKAAIELQTGSATDLEHVRQVAQLQPDNLAAQLEYAKALAGREQFAEALEVALGIIQRDRGDLREQTRELMVGVFRVSSDEDLVREYRRKLSTALY